MCLVGCRPFLVWLWLPHEYCFLRPPLSGSSSHSLVLNQSHESCTTDFIRSAFSLMHFTSADANVWQTLLCNSYRKSWVNLSNILEQRWQTQILTSQCSNSVRQTAKSHTALWRICIRHAAMIFPVMKPGLRSGRMGKLSLPDEHVSRQFVFSCAKCLIQLRGDIYFLIQYNVAGTSTYPMVTGNGRGHKMSRASPAFQGSRSPFS